MDEIFIIDASGFLYRAYFAIQGLRSREGESTGALFGFIRSYLKLVDLFHPKNVVAVFDAERSKESRTNLYKEYKAHRKPAPGDLIQQIEEAKEFCRLAGIPILSIPGVEADDTIGSIAAWAKAQPIAIVTSDKDMAQLIDADVRIINPHKEFIVVDAAKAEELYGVAPSQMRDFLAICGDASDNVPGVEGIGPKTAIQLLQQYNTLENILENAHAISGKKGEMLQKQKDLALLSQKLVTIDCQVPVPREHSYYKLSEGDKPGLWSFLKQKGFHSLLKLAGDMAPEEKSCTYHTVNTEQALKALLNDLGAASAICVDTETTDVRPMRAELVGIGLAKDAKNAYYIPFNGALSHAFLKEHLVQFFHNPKHRFFGHNIKYDLHVLENSGMPISTVVGDTIISSYLLNAHIRRHSLDELSMSYFGKKKIETAELIGKGKSLITMAQVPIEKVSEYCCEDIEYTEKLKTVLDNEIAGRGLKGLLDDIEVPLIQVLAKMETNGIYLDKKVLAGLSERVTRDIHALQETIYQMAGEPFNLNSPKQLSEVLYIKLGIRAPKKGKSQPSTSAEVLETLAYEYPICQKILEYRSLEKLRSTYIDTLPEEINPKTGRVHCTFNQSVAATGRLSCQDPNLQNIPIRSELGKDIRAAFKPESAGWSFLSADYSQIELRILAHVCEDEGLLEAFHNNLDVHAYTASEIFHVPLESVTEDMRQQAKAVNFGIIYGQQAFGLSQALHIPMSTASAFIEAYFARYKRIKEYIETAKASARRSGKVTSLTGRERLLPDINSDNGPLRTAAERLAINTPFQATAADIIKMAMIRIDRALSDSGLQARMLLQIHDELVFEMPDSEINAVTECVRQHMEQVFSLKVPLLVKIGVGKNWKEC